MTSNVRVRGASLAASALTTGAALIAALTMSFGVRLTEWSDPPRLTIVAEVAPPPKPAEITNPTPQRPADVQMAVAPLAGVPELPPAAPVETGNGPLAEPAPISIPHWLQRPRGLDRYYPGRARAAGVEGIVTMECRVTTLGALLCTILSETPPNWGFAAAALRMSEAYRMVPAMREGEPVEGRYRMRIPFTLRGPG
jgi:protein TonB